MVAPKLNLNMYYHEICLFFVLGPMSWVQKQMLNGVNPRILLSQMMGDSSHVPTQVDDLTLWKVRNIF